MSGHHFKSRRSSEFWLRCKGEMAGPCADIVLTILSILDREGSITSVQSRYSATGEYAVQGRVSLLDHSINVGTICMDHTTGVVRSLAAIAGLSHDIGKLHRFHHGRYAAIMHAQWSAEFIAGVMQGKLSDIQAKAVITAVQDHHAAGVGPVHTALRDADVRARRQELLEVVRMKVM